MAVATAQGMATATVREMADMRGPAMRPGDLVLMGADMRCLEPLPMCCRGVGSGKGYGKGTGNGWGYGNGWGGGFGYGHGGLRHGDGRGYGSGYGIAGRSGWGGGFGYGHGHCEDEGSAGGWLWS